MANQLLNYVLSIPDCIDWINPTYLYGIDNPLPDLDTFVLPVDIVNLADNSKPYYIIGTLTTNNTAGQFKKDSFGNYYIYLDNRGTGTTSIADDNYNRIFGRVSRSISNSTGSTIFIIIDTLGVGGRQGTTANIMLRKNIVQPNASNQYPINPKRNVCFYSIQEKSGTSDGIIKLRSFTFPEFSWTGNVSSFHGITFGGTDNVNGTSPLNIYEYIEFKRELSLREVQQVESYIKTKYNI